MPFILLFAGPVLAEQKPVVRDKMIVIPLKPGAVVEELGEERAVIKAPGEPAGSVQPHGRGVIVKQPGKPDVVCSPLGSRTVCR